MVPKAVILYALPIFALLIAWEILRYRKSQRPFPWMEALVSMLMAITYTFFNKHSQPLLASFNQWFYSLRLFDIPANTVCGLVLPFFAEEFPYHWLDRSVP